MTRKQAFLVLLLGLLALAVRQHIQWPSRFWESPSFQALGRDDIARILSRNQGEQEEATPVLLAPEEEPSTPKEPT
ncbi:MAG: hypothetical protein AAB413_04930 [Patescibacteria group bacterium]